MVFGDDDYDYLGFVLVFVGSDLFVGVVDECVEMFVIYRQRVSRRHPRRERALHHRRAGEPQLFLQQPHGVVQRCATQ